MVGGTLQGLDVIDHEDLADRVRQSLRFAILAGNLRPGERLVEASIAERVGVSRAPVREAIKSLAEEGLVVAVPRRGAFVNKLTAHDAREIYELRGALEALAFRLVHGNLTRDQNDALHDIVEAMGRAAADRRVDALSDLDVRFHDYVVRMSGNERLHLAWAKMNAQVGLLSRRVMDSLYADLASVARRHQRLLYALVGGSMDETAREIEEHIRSAAARVVPSLPEGSDAHET